MGHSVPIPNHPTPNKIKDELILKKSVTSYILGHIRLFPLTAKKRNKTGKPYFFQWRQGAGFQQLCDTSIVFPCQIQHKVRDDVLWRHFIP